MKREDLKRLVHLRDLDVRVMKLSEELDSLPAEYALEEQAAAAAHEQVEIGEKQLQDSRRAAQHAESDIKDHDDHIQKYAGQLATAKSNKEYDVILGQINGAKIKLSKAEEAGLEALEGVESMQKDLQRRKQVAAASDQAVAAARTRVAGREQELRAEIAAELVKRGEIVAALPPEVVDTYEHIRGRREGVALAVVIDGTCQGCYVRVTQQELMLLAQRDELVRCRSCARILVMPDLA